MSFQCLSPLFFSHFTLDQRVLFALNRNLRLYVAICKTEYWLRPILSELNHGLRRWKQKIILRPVRRGYAGRRHISVLLIKQSIFWPLSLFGLWGLGPEEGVTPRQIVNKAQLVNILSSLIGRWIWPDRPEDLLLLGVGIIEAFMPFKIATFQQHTNILFLFIPRLITPWYLVIFFR